MSPLPRESESLALAKGSLPASCAGRDRQAIALCATLHSCVHRNSGSRAAPHRPVPADRRWLSGATRPQDR